MRLALAVCAAALLALATGCSEERPDARALARDAVGAVDGAPHAAASEEPAACEEPAPALPAEMAVAAAPTAPTASTAPTAPPRPAASPRAEATEPRAAETHLPLDVLLRTPAAAARPLDLRASSAEPAAAPREPGALEEWKDRVRIESHTEATGHAGPKQGSVTQTDAGVRVPVDESVSLEGGVRVDQRDDYGAEAPTRKSMPRVGVEVRF